MKIAQAFMIGAVALASSLFVLSAHAGVFSPEYVNPKDDPRKGM